MATSGKEATQVTSAGDEGNQARATQATSDVDDGMDQERVKIKRQIHDEIKNLLESRGEKLVILDYAKIRPGEDGDFKKGKHFKVTGDIKGSGSTAESVLTIETIGTGEELVMKTMRLAKFLANEALSMATLKGMDFIPELYAVKLEQGNVHLIMENMRAQNMEKVIEHSLTIRADDPELARLFSLCVLHDILDCLEKMHRENVGHGDMHSGNVMLDTNMRVVIVDFGNAMCLQENGEFRSGLYKMDVLGATCIYTGLISGNTFSTYWSLEKKNKDGRIKQELAKTGFILTKEEEKVIDMLCKVSTEDPRQEGYRGIGSVKEQIQSMLPEKKEAIMQKAALRVFPERQTNDDQRTEERKMPEVLESRGLIGKAAPSTERQEAPPQLWAQLKSFHFQPRK